MRISELVLSSKRDDTQEYTLHLFEKCNLSCSFCWQDHKAFEGVDTVRDKIHPIKEFLSEEIKSKVIFNVMGGEVFDDSIFDQKLFDDYLFLCEETDKYGKSRNIKVTMNFVSNLVTSQPERIIELLDTLTLKGIDNKLVTSYDSRGRFNKSQFESFKNNVAFLKDRIASVSMLFTKPVIKQIMTRSDEYFQYLYDNEFEIYFDYYTPTVENNKPVDISGNVSLQTVIAPSDLDLLRVFDFLIDNYPKVQPISGWINQRKNAASCRKSKLVLSDGTKCLCGNLQLKDEKSIHFYNAKIQPADNSEIEDNFLNRWDCLSCEYFDRCQLGCFMQHDYSARGQMVECPYKMTFDKITKGKVIEFDKIKTYFGKQK